jgi:hypothetical protein
MLVELDRPPPKRRLAGLPDDPRELARLFLDDTQGDRIEARTQAVALAIVAAELGDDYWLNRARMAILILRFPDLGELTPPEILEDQEADRMAMQLAVDG